MTASPHPPLYPDVAALLAACALAAAREEPFAHTGFSGATLTRLRDAEARSFVLKRMSMARDWIMRATDDTACREAQLAAAPLALPHGVRTPAVAAARDGEGYALLMRDVGDVLLPPGAVDEATLEAIIRRMAKLHRTPPPDGVPWCDLRLRLTLLTPDGARIAGSYGAPVARDLLDGWAVFGQHATGPAVQLIRALSADPAPLLRALDALPAVFLHGDLKFDNIGIDRDRHMWLIDWAMTLVAPAAVELGWFLAINSRRLPVALDEVMDRYARAVGMPPEHRARHDALTTLCGLLLRGWRKALDAEAGEPEELRWWCEHAEAGAQWL